VSNEAFLRALRGKGPQRSFARQFGIDEEPQRRFFLILRALLPCPKARTAAVMVSEVRPEPSNRLMPELHSAGLQP
jgi:hypothetical protein